MDKREYTRRVVAVMRHLTADEMTAIRAEIEGHIEDRMEPLLALQGVDEAEAEQRSIAAMGDPEEIGRELQKHYSYFWLWVDRILLALIVFVLLGSLCLAPVHLLHARDGIVARVYPMAQAGEATRGWADQELSLKTKVGSDILRFYAVGAEPDGRVHVFWCVYDERILGRTSQWRFFYEDCRGRKADCLTVGGLVDGGQGASSYIDKVMVSVGDPYLTAVVERYGERITIDIPLTWEETL